MIDAAREFFLWRIFNEKLVVSGTINHSIRAVCLFHLDVTLMALNIFSIALANISITLRLGIE